MKKIKLVTLFSEYSTVWSCNVNHQLSEIYDVSFDNG